MAIKPGNFRLNGLLNPVLEGRIGRLSGRVGPTVSQIREDLRCERAAQDCSGHAVIGGSQNG
jgi:hypothetical protein